MHEIKKLLKTNKTGSVTGFCSAPWTNLTVDGSGLLYACSCDGYVKKPIGNILNIESKQEFFDLLNKNIMKDSILDGSYRLCDAIVCPFIQDNILLNKVNAALFQNSTDSLTNLNLKEVLLQVDQSCNLQCPSCRDGIIIHKNNEKTKKLKKILEKLENFIFLDAKEVIYVRIVGNGELFASHTMLPWFLNFDFNKFPNINFDIHTNATLISRYEDYLLKIANKIRLIEISTDAANAETYAVVRKGGNWVDFLKGMTTIKKLQTVNSRIKLNNSFVVSSLNYKDIPEFIKFAKEYGSAITFYKVLAWSSSKEKFDNLNIFSPKHPQHSDLINLFKTVDFDDLSFMSSIFNMKFN